MDLVALFALATSVDIEGPLLAEALGTTAYEAALLLRAPSPSILLRTTERSRALALLGDLRGRGHDVVACDEAAVVAAADMRQLRDFSLENDGFSFRARGTETGYVAWTDIVAVVRAVHREREEHLEKSTSRKVDLGRAAMTGGLMLTKKVTTQTAKATEAREQVAYIFPTSGAPILLRESRVHYDGLGALRKHSTVENFAALLAHVRARIPGQAYDDRLLAPRPGGDKVQSGATGTSTATTADVVDVLAHLVAMYVARRTPRPRY